MDAVLSAEPLLAKLPPEEAGEWSTGTNYELKFLKSGRPIQKAVFRRVRRAHGACSRRPLHRQERPRNLRK